MLPISTGVFGGQVASTHQRAAELTAGALARGYNRLDSKRRSMLDAREIHMCIYQQEAEHEYQQAFAAAAFCFDVTIVNY